MSQETTHIEFFNQLALPGEIQSAVAKAGYYKTTPIQALTIPPLLEGADVLGQAQTGTGKTAAFAIPMLAHIDLTAREVQVLVLTPTRELAIQVAESFKKYGAGLKGLKVLAVYGGQDYEAQFRPLKRGVHVVVGTPGRVMDHIRRETLHVGAIKGLVLDEADEMLKMGFREDVEWILEKTPPHRQTALFSATMPKPVREIAKKHMKKMIEIKTKPHTTAAETIGQRAYIIRKNDRLEALSRILEAEEVEAMLIFVRRKMTTAELAEKIFKMGYSCVGLNGDMAQNMREATVKRFKNGEVKILVATEVAARGLDLRRISHVVNYDVPEDPQIYVHRIGRTGRAGDKGHAILFLTTREKGFLRTVEQETKQPIAVLPLPSTEDINAKRISSFKKDLTTAMRSGKAAFYRDLIDEYARQSRSDMLSIAAGLAVMAEGETPLLFKETFNEQRRAKRNDERDDAGADRGASRPARGSTPERAPRATERPERAPRSTERPERAPRSTERPERAPRSTERPERSRDASPVEREERESRGPRERYSATPLKKGMSRYRIGVGSKEGISPGDVIKTVTATTGMEDLYIGRITIEESYSTVDLPIGIPELVMVKLADAQLKGKRLEFRLVKEGEVPGRKGRPAPRKARAAAPKKSAGKRAKPGTGKKRAPAGGKSRKAPAKSKK